MPLVSAGVWLDDGANEKAYPPLGRRRQHCVDLHPFPPPYPLNFFGPYNADPPAPRYATPRPRPEATSFVSPLPPQDYFGWPELSTRFPSPVPRGRPSYPADQPLAPAVGASDDAMFAVWRVDGKRWYPPPARPRPAATDDAFPPLDRSLGWSMIMDQYAPRYLPQPRRSAGVEFCPLPIYDYNLAWMPADVAPVRRLPVWRATDTPGLFISELASEGLRAFTDQAPARRVVPRRSPAAEAFDFWQASGLILTVGGPYFAVAQDLFVAGAVTGDIRGT